jgi:hypothetical protein
VRGIEAARRFDEAEIAFVDQIQEGHAVATVALRVRDDKAKIRLDELRHRGFVAIVLDARAERAFLVRRQAWKFCDFPKVGTKRTRVFIPPRHGDSIHQS